MSVTEAPSHYDHLEQMPVRELLEGISREDHKVPDIVKKAIPQIEKLVNGIVERMNQGGRLFYVGAGTSGRLGIVDASECPPTYGVPHDLVIAVMAGGDAAIRKAVEFAEDDPAQAWKDLQAYEINAKDALVGIAASGRTPYVIGGVKDARKAGVLTGCITCNPDTELAAASKIPVEVITGPEFVTGSTRMKAGTAQKLVLNMISTAVMIQMGRVKGNRMVDMQLSNTKLVNRGILMVMESLQLNKEEAEALLMKYGSVRKAILSVKRE